MTYNKNGEFELNLITDVSDIADSMLLDSETLIAEYKERNLYAEIRVRGAVKVIYKDEYYTQPSEFPKELIDRIKNNPNMWDTCSPSGEGNDEEESFVYICENNWFELFIYDEGSCEVATIVDIENYSKEEIIETIVDAVNDYKIQKIKDEYTSNKKDIKVLEENYEEYKKEYISKTYEDGYNDALEFVLETFGVEI